MTLSALIFDLAAIPALFLIKKFGPEARVRRAMLRDASEETTGPIAASGEPARIWRCCSPKPEQAEAARLLLGLSKSGALAVSAAWVLTDLLVLADSGAGPGFLPLGYTAATASLLVLILEVGVWLSLLPDSLRKLSTGPAPGANRDDVGVSLAVRAWAAAQRALRP